MNVVFHVVKNVNSYIEEFLQEFPTHEEALKRGRRPVIVSIEQSVERSKSSPKEAIIQQHLRME